MAKQAAMGDRLLVGGVNLSGDIGSLQRIAGGPAGWDVTCIDKLAYERIGLERDGGIDFTSYFNKAVSAAHLTLSPLPRTDTLVSYFRGTALGGPMASCVAKQVGYDWTRGQDGSLTIGVNSVANGYGLEWGVQLTAGIKTDTAATNGTGVDLTTVSTSTGWQAYLHVPSITGTSVTVTIQDSADNVSFANITGAAFTAVASPGPGWQRLQAASATAVVRRYVRAITTGTFSNAQFAVQFVRNEIVGVTF